MQQLLGAVQQKYLLAQAKRQNSRPGSPPVARPSSTGPGPSGLRGGAAGAAGTVGAGGVTGLDSMGCVEGEDGGRVTKWIRGFMRPKGDGEDGEEAQR